MSQDMGAAILYQLQQLNINSGALSVRMQQNIASDNSKNLV